MLLWLDMEMTGLDVNIEVPIEVACIVTDWHFNPQAQYHAVIKQPQEFLDRMDSWNTDHHKKSGLTDMIAGGKSPETVEDELCQLVKKTFGTDKPILAGNSIGQDRLFITKYFKQFDSLLHYRMVDVSSWKVMYNNCFSLKFPKKQSHRALDDVQESIDELKFYMQFVKPTAAAGNPVA
jgi:oligoribonuclease